MHNNLTDAAFYRNKRGDFLGPMEERAGMFIDQYGTVYWPNGQQLHHVETSTGNIDANSPLSAAEIKAAALAPAAQPPLESGAHPPIGSDGVEARRRIEALPRYVHGYSNKDGITLRTLDEAPKGDLLKRDDVLVALQPPRADETPTHRHVKRGTEYRLLAFGTFVSLDPATDDADVCVYQAVPGVWHVRWAFAEIKGEAAWARMQCSKPVTHGSVVAVYQSMDDAMLWVRPREEFEDGRFEAIEPARIMASLNISEAEPVARYDIDPGEGQLFIDEKPDGEWVRWNDLAAIIQPLYASPTTSPQAPEGVRDDVLATAARELIASRFDTYRAGNNRQVGIQDDNGEKCWIVPFDEMAALEAALKGNRT